MSQNSSNYENPSNLSYFVFKNLQPFRNSKKKLLHLPLIEIDYQDEHEVEGVFNL